MKIIFERNKTPIENKQCPEIATTSVTGIYVSDHQIPRGVYTGEPSFSEMEFKVNVLHFIHNREKYSTEFMLPKHKQFRD